MTDKKTPAYKIFHYLYRVYIPQHHLYTREYIEQFGIPSSGDSGVDRELANSKVLTRQTIAQMAELYNDGATMSLEDPSKSVEIYEVLKEHLRNWEAKVRNNVFEIDIPMDDLRKLDELAGEIFKVAKGYMKSNPTDSKLFSSLSRLNKRTGVKINDVRSNDTTVRDSEYKPVVDTIAKEQFSRKRRARN